MSDTGFKAAAAPRSGWFRRWFRRPSRLGRILSIVSDMGARLERTERLVLRIQKDAERVRLHTALVLGAERAISLLATGDRIYVDPRDTGCGINLLSEGRYEEDEMRWFRRFLKPGTRMLDIGANYGIYAITAAPYIRPGGRIIAFEPNPHIHGLLSSSIYLNGLIDVIEPRRVGVSDTNGELRFEINANSPGGARVLLPHEEPRSDHVLTAVPVVRLDDQLGPDAIVDLVKIDVEGHEENVLRGMQGVIARSPDIKIFIELFYLFFRSDEDFVRTLAFITDDLQLTPNRILDGGRTEVCDAAALRGQTCNLILSRGPLAPTPDLTIHPSQLHIGADARRVGETVEWVSPGPASGERMIAHGPYVFLPAGRYRLVIDADIEGAADCRLLENYGDLIWRQRLGPGGAHVAELTLELDAPRLEIGFWSSGSDPARFVLRRIEFWAA
ncbi:FkbM family methyltransferase [Sphingomonas profundi]|uniref:FkbM family methyltransferase n=1 Tax=Alterirhizorhabdus profundi TaxID=2681549 RepID=UPI0012E86F63|nr:FkbM family methyltransferase [Sphingomonas profundi]